MLHNSQKFEFRAKPLIQIIYSMKFKGKCHTERKPKIHPHPARSDFIKIFCRIRPNLQKELVPYLLKNNEIHVHDQQFKFTRIFDQGSSQAEVA